MKKLGYIRETRLNLHEGMVSFLLQRITGLALVFYLLMHVTTLSSIFGGSSIFRRSLEAYDTPVFHFVEWALLAAVLFHMFNGLRIIIADWLGVTRAQRGMFWVAFLGTAAICLASIPFFFWR